MYELMVIAKSDSSDEVFGKVEKFLKDIDAVSVKAEKLGKKILAYPIAKQTEGDYFLYNFEADTQALKGLADKIRLEQEAILRHMLVKVEKQSVSKRQSLKVSKKETEEKIEEVREKPKVTVTTRTKVSSSSAKASADAKALADRSEDKEGSKVTKQSKVKKVKKPKAEKKGKK